jgi:hypothetical protein
MADTATTKLSLGIKDRLTIPAFFPERSNFVDQILKEDIANKIRITQEDIAAVGLHYSEPSADGKQFMTWARDKEVDKEIEFTDAEIKFLKKQVDRLDKDANLSDDEMGMAKALRGI